MSNITTEAICKRCGKTIPGSPVEPILAKLIARFAVICTECETAIRRAKADEIGLRRWQELCPPSLQTADDGRSSAAGQIVNDLDRALGGALILWIVGPCRSGKTRAAYQSTRQPIIAGKSCEAANIADLAATLPMRSGEYIGGLIERLQAAQILILDDIDKATYTPKFAQLIYCILNSRILQNRKTIITSNLSLTAYQALLAEQATAFAGPIASRIIENASIVVVK